MWCAGTLVEKTDISTMVVNTEVDTLIESNLGTMIINDTDDDDNDESTAADDSDTMKRQFSCRCHCCLHLIVVL